MALEELAIINIRKDLFPHGELRSIGWEILVALYNGEETPGGLAEAMGYTFRDSMVAAFERHLECLEAAGLVISDNQGEGNQDEKIRLTPDARNMIDCYFRERTARASRS